MRLQIPIVGQHSENRSFNVNSQMTINLQPQIETDGAKNPISIQRTDGFVKTGSASSGACRVVKPIFWKGNGYTVVGVQLVKITPTGVATAVGVLNTNGGNVSMSANPNHIGLVDGTNGYTYDGTTFAQIGDVDFPNGSTQMIFMDGFSIANQASSGILQISSLRDTTAWDALEFAEAEANPDTLTALAATRKVLWLFGPNIAEMWYHSDNTDFPFQPYRNGTVEWGIHAPFSLAQGDESLFWLSSNAQGKGIVLGARGASPVAISTPDIESQIADLGTTSDAQGWVYTASGHIHYVLTFPTSDLTLVYDTSTKMWHRRKSFGIGRWRTVGAVFTGNKHFAGDFENNNIYELRNDIYDENGAIMEAIRVTQVTHKDGHRLRLDRLQLDIETGVGLLAGQGVDPIIMMRYSKDGGHHWSYEKHASLGKFGETGLRVYWTKLGIGRQWVFEFKITDPVKVSIFGGYADITVCRP